MNTKIDDDAFIILMCIERMLNAINRCVSCNIQYDLRFSICALAHPRQPTYPSGRITLTENVGMYNCWLHINLNRFEIKFHEEMGNKKISLKSFL